MIVRTEAGLWRGRSTSDGWTLTLFPTEPGEERRGFFAVPLHNPVVQGVAVRYSTMGERTGGGRRFQVNGLLA